MKALRLKNIYFRYTKDSDYVLKNLDFSLSYGEIALLCGASGSGKSTLLNLMCGLIPNVIKGYLDGEIYINDNSINGKKQNEISRDVGIVLQNADSQIIYPKVEDEISFGLENFNFPVDEIQKQIDFATSLLKLDKEADSRMLSGGQKQRLTFASTMATKQKIIILDEPLANLDAQGSIILMNLLAHLKMQGYAILICEHRLENVLPFVDSVYVCENKRITKIDDREKLLEDANKEVEDIGVNLASDTILFDLKNVEYKVKKKEIVKGVSFQIRKGERVLLIGENGCGKTTILRLIAKLNKLTKGDIEQSVIPKLKRNKSNSEWFKKVGVVYQNPNYQLFMPTVYKEVDFSSISTENTMNILEELDLINLKDRHPQSLSEGQKRRLTVACVLASNPEVILLDEPTVGQDYETLMLISNALNNYRNKTKATIITITHDIRCIRALCDKTVLIKDGKVEEVGDVNLALKYFENLYCNLKK